VTSQVTSDAASESVAVIWDGWVEKMRRLEGETDKVTGAGGEEELQPVENRIRAKHTNVPTKFRFIIYPKREEWSWRQHPYEVWSRPERSTGDMRLQMEPGRPEMSMAFISKDVI